MKFARSPFLLAFVAGAVSAFAFQPVGLWPLMPLAFAALCELLTRTRSLKGALATGWLFGLGQFVIGLNWIATAFTYQAAMPAWLGWIAVVLLSLYLAVYPMLAAGIAWTFGRHRPIAMVLGLAGAWAIAEWLRAGIFTGFAWNPVAATFDNTHLLNATATVGTYGLSAIVVLAGGLIFLLVRRDRRSAGGVAVALLLLHFLPRAELAADSGLAIRVVQPNIGQQDKWRPGYSEIAAQRLAQLSMEQRPDGPRLLFWPEAAVTNPMLDERSQPYGAYADFERARAASLVGPGDYLLTGGIALFSKDKIAVSGAANSVFVFGQGGRLVGRYDKAHLVPYGEYLPMRPLLSTIGLSRLAPGDVDFLPGPGPRTIELPGWGKVGFQLCYEIIFSGQVVDRRNRPDFIFNPSNDAWFGAWGPPQHLAQARLRAAEEGIPVIRSTPTGISAVIDAHGQVVQSLPWRTAGYFDGTLPPPAAKPTLFARFGNVLPLGIGFLLVIAAIALGRTGRYRRNT
ncbi:apolipoprotein N-acyltransferase [Sphingomonas daechungensis]|uniref:apolipoprotein N-acyltransferase n=1 Tax=Sphingomonas daechungensis TaxID=1176646 RepID=UPI003783817B